MIGLKPIRSFQKSKVFRPRNFAPFQAPLQVQDTTRPLDLEIGCGVGWRPIAYALENPGRHLIAIEQTREKFEKFSTRLDRHSGIANLSAVHADAVAWVTHALPSHSLSRCDFFYPNPEPKAASRRWIRMPFFGELLTKMKADGQISFVTNEPAYAEELRQYGVGAWGLQLAVDREFGIEDQPRARTHFEKKYLARGERCFELQFRKP